MKIVYLIFVLAVAIVAVIFAVQNGAPVDISFFSWSASGSLSLVLMLTLTLGILLGLLIMAPSVWKRWFQSSGLKRRLHRLEREKLDLARQAAAAAERAGDDAKPDGGPAERSTPREGEPPAP